MKSKANDHSKYPNWISPEECVPYEKNAKEHTTKQIDNIANSIKRFGWQQDVVLTADNVLVIGHGRRLAALKLGCEMPYHRIDKNADELTDNDIKELRIADNQTNAETGYDYDILQSDIEGLDFEGFDFDFGLGEEEEEKEEEVKGELQFAEVLDEESNYIVLKFRDRVDWTMLESIFELPKVKNYPTRKDGKEQAGFNRKGVGRVVDGVEFLNRIGVSM